MKEKSIWDLINHDYPNQIDYPSEGDWFDTLYELWIDDIEVQLTRINPNSKELIVEGRDIGWQKKAGILSIPEGFPVTTLIQKLSYASNGTLTFFYDDAIPALFATYTHHDNPVNGDKFVIFAKGTDYVVQNTESI